MLKQMRTNTKWIMVIVIIGFVGMIVFQWGMEISSRRTGVEAGIIGKVNNTEISYEYYDQIIRNQQNSLGTNQRITLDQSRMIHNEVWNYIVSNILIEQEIEKLDITYTDEELIGYMMTVPISAAYQSPMFMEEGVFSLSKYQAFIQNPANLSDAQGRQLLDYIEMQARQLLPRVKLQQNLENSVIVKEPEIREKWLRENEQRKIDWIYVNTSTLGTYPETVDTEDARNYYDEHKEDYSHEELRALDIVFFELSPTAIDTTEASDRANLLAERAASGEDFAELADGYSEDPGNTNVAGGRNGGDLGFFSRGTMTKVFEDVAFSLNPGEISDPFLSPFGYHIVKVDSIKYKEDSEEIDQVKARHILLKIEPSGETQEMVENRAKAFHESVNSGMDFNLKAQADSLNVVSTTLFVKEVQYIPNIGANAQLLLNRIFRANNGDLLSIYNTDTGYYVIKVSKIEKSGIYPFEEVENQAVEGVKNEMRAKYIEDYCNRVNENLKSNMNLSEAVESVADTLITTSVMNDTVNRIYSGPGIGAFNPLVVKVFSLENEGECTGTVVADNGSGIAVLLEKTPIDENKFEEEKEQLKIRLENEYKNELMSKYLEQLNENAEIVDNRDIFMML